MACLNIMGQNLLNVGYSRINQTIPVCFQCGRAFLYTHALVISAHPLKAQARPNDRRIALCVFDDMIEFGSPGSNYFAVAYSFVLPTCSLC